MRKIKQKETNIDIALTSDALWTKGSNSTFESDLTVSSKNTSRQMVVGKILDKT